MSLLQPFALSLAAKNLTLDDFARCLGALESGKAIHGSAPAQSLLWSHIEQAQAELREMLALSGRELRINVPEKCAMAVVAGPAAEADDGGPAPRPKAYSHPGVSSHTLACGLFALSKTQRTAGDFSSDGTSHVAPSDVLQFIDAQFGLALLDSDAKQQALFEAFAELGFVARMPGGQPGPRALFKEPRVAVLPALDLAMDPVRLRLLTEHVEAKAAARAGSASSAPPSTEPPGSIAFDSAPSSNESAETP